MICIVNTINAGTGYILELRPLSSVAVLISWRKIMTAAANQQRFETIQGVVERLTYHSEESGYSVARLKLLGIKNDNRRKFR